MPRERREARVRTVASFLIVCALLCGFAIAAETHAPSAEHATHATTAQSHAPAANEAVLPPIGIRWPAVVVFVVLGMFFSAMVIGPIVRMLMPEEPPAPAAHHDDHGGHDHAHGGHH